MATRKPTRDDPRKTTYHQTALALGTSDELALVKALYDGSPKAHLDVEVTFEDGRKGRIEGDIVIRDVAVEAKPRLEKAA